MKAKFIGIFGQKNVGKTTLAQMIYNELDKWFTKRPIFEWMNTPKGFAQPIKEMLSKMTGLTIERINALKNIDEILPEWNCTVRQALQKIGQCGREIHPNMWIYQRMMNRKGVELIDDGRHLNEANAVYTAGGYLILMTRPGFENKDQHESEREFDSIKQKYLYSGEYMNRCLLVDNCSTIEALREVTKKALIPHILTHFGYMI